MDVGATSAATASNTAQAAAQLSQTFDQFLTLLTTQLKFQDPLEPLDSNEFVNQLVQFSNVEQQIASNVKLDQLIGLQGNNQVSAALGYIGQTVEAKGDTAPLANGKAEYTYTLEGGAATTTIGVVNSAGQIVYTAPAETQAGKHSFVWDGLDNNGVLQPDGPYKIQVVAQKADGSPVNVSTGIVGQVTGVDTSSGALSLSLGSVSLSFDQITAVKATPVSDPNA